MRAMLRIIFVGLLCSPLFLKAGNEVPSSAIDFFAAGGTTGCPSLSVQFVPEYMDDGNDPYVSWEWDFGDGATSTEMFPTHIYTTQGLFTVQLKMVKQSGAQDIVTKEDYVNTQSNFDVDLGPDTTICSGSAIILDATTPGATYLWNDGSTTPQIETFFEGEYYVEVNKGGCTDRDTIYVTVGALLSADFAWSTVSGCSPIPAEFTDMSQSCNGAIVEWNWDFGDGKTSTEKNPVHNYDAPGEYTVLLTVKNSNGSFTSQNYTVTIEGQVSPALELGEDFDLCHDSTIVLHAGNPGATYSWNTGAITESIIATGGNKYILTVEKDGCSITDSVTIGEIPTLHAVFSEEKNTSCFPIKMKFTDKSSHCGGDIVAWQWDFGDGIYSYEQHPEHEFTTAGDFPVTLTVFHEWGEVDDTTVIIHVEPLNISVDLGADAVICEGGTITLNAGNTGASYLWSTGETSQEIVAGFEGQYSVTVSFEGCEVKDTMNLQLKPAAVVNYSYDVGAACLPVAVNFADETILDCSQTASSWYWEFGDGETSTEQNPVHQYTSAGNFSVKLTVTASGGGSASSSRTITINNTIHTVDLPEQLKICKGASVHLDAAIADAHYNWSPAVGINDITVQDPVVAPPASGYYYVDVTKCMVTARDSVLILLDSIGRPTVTQEGNMLKASLAASYQWYREGVAVAGATGKTIKADRRGYYTVKTFNSTGCEKESNSFFFLPVSGREKGGEIRIKCSPNPSNGIINILLSEIPHKPAKVTVYDLRGTRLLTAQVKENVNPINAVRLSKGLYMVEVIFDGRRTTLPVVVQ